MVPHTRADVLAWCRTIDDGPWSSLAVPERITYTSHDLVVELAAAAALTERVRLWSTIVVLPAHDAVDMAKKMASIDVLSGGRLTMGIGVGGREDDYRAVGAPFNRRWARMDEQVATMRKVWSGEPPFEGADPVGPPPVHGDIPLVSGSMGPKAMARAAQWADGVDGPWTITGGTVGLIEGVEMVRQAWRDAGRDDQPHISTSAWYALGPDAGDRLKGYAYDYLRIFGPDFAQAMADRASSNSAEALRGLVEECAAAGIDELFLVPTTADVSEIDRTRDALGV
ncbi:MAG: LLM class flavin-dependent oxidoreductase [Acidimicrobiales bacterium]|nr:LLM class flavin-dependent oxidoreductase [Acidimicrobiales bacterium]